MKYIDSEKLIAEIERRIEEYNIQSLRGTELSDLLSFITSLQQEQPEVDLEKEIIRFLSNSAKMNKGEWRGKYAISEIGFRAVAHHFYELGLNARKED